MADLELTPQVLTGRFVRLEPYAPDLREELASALDVDPEAWSLFNSSGQGEHFDSWWASHTAEIDRGARVSYAVRRIQDGRLVGTTSFLSIRPRDRGVEIGSTFYRPEARGGPINPECKLLLLDYAFGAGAWRVELVTDARNLRSQAAIAKLGAVREGVLRRHKLTWTGHVRDTVIYSIIAEDWPEVRTGLMARLAAI